MLLTVTCAQLTCYLQQSVQYTGKRCDSDTAGHTKADIVVEHVFWRTAKGTVHINSACHQEMAPLVSIGDSSQSFPKPEVQRAP